MLYPRDDSELPRKLEHAHADIRRKLEAALNDDAAQQRLLTALNLVGRHRTGFSTQLRPQHGENPLAARLQAPHCGN